MKTSKKKKTSSSPKKKVERRKQTIEIKELMDCGICLDRPKEIGRMETCDHVFCFDCIKSWSDIHNHCPYCNVQFKYIAKIDYKTGSIAMPFKKDRIKINNKDNRNEVWTDGFYYSEGEEELGEEEEDEFAEEEDQEQIFLSSDSEDEDSLNSGSEGSVNDWNSQEVKEDWEVAFRFQFGFYPLSRSFADSFIRRNGAQWLGGRSSVINLLSDEEEEEEENEEENEEEEESPFNSGDVIDLLDESFEEDPDCLYQGTTNTHIRFEEEEEKKAKHIRFKDDEERKHIRFDVDGEENKKEDVVKKRNMVDLLSSSSEEDEDDLEIVPFPKKVKSRTERVAK